MKKQRTDRAPSVPGGLASPRSTLISRNFKLGSKRTSIRLEASMWDALAEVCRREGVSLGEQCKQIDAVRRESTLTAAIRVFLLSYFKAAATEEGHASAGHGTLGFARRGGERADRQAGSSGPV